MWNTDPQIISPQSYCFFSSAGSRSVAITEMLMLLDVSELCWHM